MAVGTSYTTRRRINQTMIRSMRQRYVDFESLIVYLPLYFLSVHTFSPTPKYSTRALKRFQGRKYGRPARANCIFVQRQVHMVSERCWLCFNLFFYPLMITMPAVATSAEVSCGITVIPRCQIVLYLQHPLRIPQVLNPESYKRHREFPLDAGAIAC